MEMITSFRSSCSPFSHKEPQSLSTFFSQGFAACLIKKVCNIFSKQCLIKNNKSPSRVSSFCFCLEIQPKCQMLFTQDSHTKPMGFTLCLNGIWDVARTDSYCSEAAPRWMMSCPCVWRERRVAQTAEETGVYNINVEGKQKSCVSSRQGNGVYSSLLLGQIYYQSSFCFVYLCSSLWCACALLVKQRCWPWLIEHAQPASD